MMPNSNNTPPVMRGGAEVKFEPLKNKAAIEFLKRKVPEVSKHWDDFIAPVHAHSFTIAGAPTIDFLVDMQNALVKAIEQGTSLGAFRKDFDATVKKFGWPYNGKRGWRTRVIYQTNMRIAQMAAKWQTLQANKDIAPFLEYKAVMDSRTRPLHRSWDGTIRRIDDAFWDTHYPPNGWGCRCTVIAHSNASLKRKGLSESPPPKVVMTSPRVGEQYYHAVPHGIDPGWESNVGISWLAPELAMGKRLADLPEILSAHAYQRQLSPSFLKAVSNSWGAMFEAISQKRNEELFFGYIRSDVHQALAQKTDEIIERSAAFNLKQTDRHKIDTPSRESLLMQNLAVLVPDFKQKHLLGSHRNKDKLKQSLQLSDQEARYNWPIEWIRQAPLLFHQSELVFYDIQGQSLAFLTNKSKEVDGVLRYGVIYIRLNQKAKYPTLANWVVSFEAKPLKDIKANTVILVDKNKGQP